MKKSKEQILRISAILLLYLILVIAGTALFWPVIQRISTPEGQAAF